MDSSTSSISQKAAPPNERIAIWSLILGIGSFVFEFPLTIWNPPIPDVVLGVILLGPLAALLAVCCGHLARVRVKKSGGALRGGGMALAGAFAGYVNLVLVAAAIIMPMCGRPSPDALLSSRMAVAKGVSYGLKLYANDHEGNLPARLEDLRPDYMETPSTSSLRDFEHEFILLHAGEKLETLDANTVVLVSVFKDTKGRSAICFADGRVVRSVYPVEQKHSAGPGR